MCFDFLAKICRIFFSQKLSFIRRWIKNIGLKLPILYILHADLTRVDEPTVCDTMAGSVSFRWLILKFVSWQDCEGHALTRRLFHHLIW